MYRPLVASLLVLCLVATPAEAGWLNRASRSCALLLALGAATVAARVENRAASARDEQPILPITNPIVISGEITGPILGPLALGIRATSMSLVGGNPVRDAVVKAFRYDYAYSWVTRRSFSRLAGCEIAFST